MEVQLTRNVNAEGTEITKAWCATLSNDDGTIVAQCCRITARAALDDLARILTRAMNSVSEMRGLSEGSNRR